MSSSQPYRFIPTEDRVSSIPDSILSFLPTKDSVATSVLSKQWNPLWLLVLDLNFDSQTFKDYITFSHVVYLVIVSREITLPIRSLCLKFGKEYSINDINRFINAAIQRGIENLDIDMLEDVNGLTSSIFSCKTLTVLKLLKNLFVKDDNYQVDLPLLKVLCIDIMRFSYQATITKFFLGCPVIEELRTKIAAFYLRKLNPETPNLMRTSIPSQYISLYFLSRVEILRLNMA
ncbi:F-box/FBD/LRR-repeat protein At4g26340 [Medicago truncatula]|uniref:F-box/FBD-like domain protein, putative n=2 Tax=Medicago truncatula TaxID=3880 RepID=G7ZZU9_MEDTR|nr:F-box/FBD/LRR-repeat protein At4g26340 [Medicago truncatula]KEH32701.1 F-box/FBD-like domain protein, putative [Medicago truncatula]